MESEELYELVADAVRQALEEDHGGQGIRISRRMLEGRVEFTDGQGRTVKELAATTVFKKITAVRERLRVLEQKINNNGALTASDKAALQAYITRSYGSLTTFNFMFRDERDKFRGSSS